MLLLCYLCGTHLLQQTVLGIWTVHLQLYNLFPQTLKDKLHWNQVFLCHHILTRDATNFTSSVEECSQKKPPQQFDTFTFQPNTLLWFLYFLFSCILVLEFAGKWQFYLINTSVCNDGDYYNSSTFSSVFSAEACCSKDHGLGLIRIRKALHCCGKPS